MVINNNSYAFVGNVQVEVDICLVLGQDPLGVEVDVFENY